MSTASRRPLHAILDARWIFRELSGIGRYTRELAGGLARTAEGRRLTLIFSDADLARRELEIMRIPSDARVDTCLFPYGPFSIGSQLNLSQMIRSSGAQVYHSPNFMMPLPAFSRSRPRGRTAAVTTLHDLIPVLHPEFTPKARKNAARGLVRWLMREAVRRSDRVITPSVHTRSDILNALDASAGDRIRVVPEAASPAYSPGEPPPVPGQILFVGRRDPYKNLTSLIEAFARVSALLPHARLRIISAPDARYPEPEQIAQRLGITDRVEWCGYVESSRIVEAYRQASVFVLASLYEGFGLPVLEAMACGTPVICSNTSSLPEVAGDAAVLVDPRKVSSIADALLRVLSDPQLSGRLRSAGLARARLFSWDRAARETWALYEEAACAR